MKCFNRNVLIGLAVAAGAVFLVAPAAARSVVPLLLVAACPLSMVFMMRGMSKMGSSGRACATDQPEPPRQLEDKDAEIARLTAMLEERAPKQQPSAN